MPIMLGELFLPAIIFPIGLVFALITLTLLPNAALKNVRVGPSTYGRRTDVHLVYDGASL